jgi:hypothetical protein
MRSLDLGMNCRSSWTDALDGLDFGGGGGQGTGNLELLINAFHSFCQGMAAML